MGKINRCNLNIDLIVLFFFSGNIWFPKQIICLSNEFYSWIQNAAWTPVPQFGGWDQKGPNDATNYSVVFSKARANRKQNKAGVRHSSLGSEQELMVSVRRNHQQLHHRHETQDDDPVMVIKLSLSTYSSMDSLVHIHLVMILFPLVNAHGSSQGGITIQELIFSLRLLFVLCFCMRLKRIFHSISFLTQRHN